MNFTFLLKLVPNLGLIKIHSYSWPFQTYVPSHLNRGPVENLSTAGITTTKRASAASLTMVVAVAMKTDLAVAQSVKQLVV